MPAGVKTRRRRKKPQPANIFKGERPKASMSDMLDNSNPESGFHDKKEWVHRKIGAGIVKPMLPRVIKIKILTKSTRQSSLTDMYGDRYRRRATMTFPKNRCARCTRMLSSRNRYTIEAEGQQHDLSFCMACATDMVSGS